MDQSTPRRRKASGPRSAARGETPAARAARIERIRQMIDDGTYETEERWEAAVSRMFSQISD
ncbi:MAG: flagellar biosynthesis anti-sigma factor FlgM [Planctomycetaceae bacterium]|nr:flagellar biosynthesis anti-sigma factor FlgM [Planctomycetaceae bacterium]